MATEKQIAANRANASKGGPKTEEGKKICRLAAIKHGLTCKTLVVIPGESEEEYLTLLDQFSDSFKPTNAIEQSVVVRLANAHWRSQRKEGVEAGLLWWEVVRERHITKKDADAAGKGIDHIPQEHYIGLGFYRNNGAMERYLRYAASIDREFHKTLDELMKLQKLRQTAPQPAQTETRKSTSANRTNYSANPEIGTVSQFAQSAAPAGLNSSHPAPGSTGNHSQDDRTPSDHFQKHEEQSL